MDLAIQFGFLFGLSFFLGLAFEDVSAHEGLSRPGGIRTFPMLALVGGLLYLSEPTHAVGFTAGLIVVGAWLTIYYREHISQRDEQGRQNVGLMVVLLNLYAYLLGGVVFALPAWVGVGTTVAAVLLFTGRKRLHALAGGLELREIITAAEFLVLTGLVLPLLPDHPVTTLTSITPRQAWLALVVVCSLSYASYLLQRYIAPRAGALWMAALGGLYSSTATTVVLARRARDGQIGSAEAQAGVTLATSIMYVRILVVVSAFNLALAAALAPWFLGLFLFAIAIAAWQYRYGKPQTAGVRGSDAVPTNPLELGPAVLFATLFIATSLLAAWVERAFGAAGIYALAAVIGVTDIDPFVLNIAQGSVPGLSTGGLAAAVLIAASSNNVLKAGYAIAFGGGAARQAAGALLVLAATGAGIAIGVLH